MAIPEIVGSSWQTVLSSLSSPSLSSCGSGSGVPNSKAMLWSTKHAIMIWHDLSGLYRNSACRQWNRRLRTPLHLPIVTLVLTKAWLYATSGCVWGIMNGVSNHSRNGYALSPRINPSIGRGFPSKALQTEPSLKMRASCTDPGYLTTQFNKRSSASQISCTLMLCLPLRLTYSCSFTTGASNSTCVPSTQPMTSGIPAMA